MTTFEDQVQQVLEELRPAIRADGGEIELVKADEGKGRVEVHLSGACQHCDASMITLTQGVEARLKQVLPGVREVLAV